MAVNRDYAILLLSKTRLTYNQISELSGLKIGTVADLAHQHRPKEIRELNIIAGTTPDVQEELLKLKEELAKQMTPEEIETSEALVRELQEEDKPSGIHRKVVFQFEAKTNKAVDKQLLLDELQRLEEYVNTIHSDAIELYIGIEGA